MGYKLVEWAMSLDGVKGWTKAVLVVTAAKSDDKSAECFPSQKTLASACGASLATVNRSLDQLESMGVLSRSRRSSAAGYRTSDLITLNRAWISVSQLGTEPTRQAANLADSKSLDVTLQEPNYQGDRTEEDQSHDQSVDQSDTAIVEAIDPQKTFAEFYFVWPKKKNRPAAEKAWAKAVKRAPADSIYAAAVAYTSNPHRPEKQYIPYPATWLNAEGWNDELDGPRVTGRPTNTDRALDVVARYAAQERAETRGLTS